MKGFSRSVTRHPLRSIAVHGILSFALYLFAFVLPFNLFTLIPKRVPPDIAWITGYRPLACLVYVLTISALFGSYLLAWSATRHVTQESRTAVRRLIWGFAILFSLSLAFLYPLTAQDVFLYICRGRILVVHRANPMRWPLAAFPVGDYLPFQTEWLGQRSPYGPLWEYLAGIATLLGDHGLASALLSYKGLAILSYLGCGMLIGAILRRRQPAWELAGILFFTWNPLVLLETAGGGHNDATMMFFVLLALWLREKHQMRWAISALVLGALVKYLPLMLIPPVLIDIWKGHARKEKWAIIIQGGLISIALTLAIWGPLWPGLENWDMLRQVAQANNSPGTLLIMLLLPYLPSRIAFNVGRALLFGVFAICYFVLLARLARAQISLQHAMYYALFWYLLLASLTFGHWYLIWLVALAAITTDRSIHLRTVIFAWAAELSIAIYAWLYHWMLGRWSAVEIYLLAIPLVFILPLLAPILIGSQSKSSPTYVTR